MEDFFYEITELDIRFSDIALIVLSVNVAFFVKIFRERTELKWFAMTLISALIIQILAHVFAYKYGNNLPLLHLHTLLEFIFISLFYRQILFSKHRLSVYLLYFIGVVSILIVANSVFLEPLTGFNGNAKGLSQSLIIIYTILYFFSRISTEVREENMYLNKINASILLYYSGSLFIFIFASFLAKNSPVLNHYFWEFNALLYLVFQLLILVATWRLVFPTSIDVKGEE